MRHYGIPNASDRAYGAAAALTYWVFKARDRKKSPAMGTKTWTYLESSIQNAAEVSSDLESYLQRLCDSLISTLRPAILSEIVQPEQRIYRVFADMAEIKEVESDRAIPLFGWHDLLTDAAQEGHSEWDVLERCRTKASIVQVLCRFRFEEDKALNQDVPEEALEVDATDV